MWISESNALKTLYIIDYITILIYLAKDTTRHTNLYYRITRFFEFHGFVIRCK